MHHTSFFSQMASTLLTRLGRAHCTLHALVVLQIFFTTSQTFQGKLVPSLANDISHAPHKQNI